jgi:hypothetical protein
MMAESPPRAWALSLSVTARVRSLMSMADSEGPPGAYGAGRTLSETVVPAVPLVDPSHLL